MKHKGKAATIQSIALSVAEETIKRMGFVVVGYREFPPPIGERTSVLWRVCEMPQPFVVVRQATDGEYAQQVAIATEMAGRAVNPEPGLIPMVLVTD